MLLQLLLHSAASHGTNLLQIVAPVCEDLVDVHAASSDQLIILLLRKTRLDPRTTIDHLRVKQCSIHVKNNRTGCLLHFFSHLPFHLCRYIYCLPVSLRFTPARGIPFVSRIPQDRSGSEFSPQAGKVKQTQASCIYQSKCSLSDFEEGASSPSPETYASQEPQASSVPDTGSISLPVPGRKRAVPEQEFQRLPTAYPGKSISDP